MLKLLFIVITAQSLVAAALKKKSDNEHITALFVKDNENGELRFLTGTNSVDQLITQKQDMLEQLLPSNSSSNTIKPIYIYLNDNNAATTSPTTSGTITSTDNTGTLNNAANNNSPIAALLPQIVVQVVAGSGSSTGTGTGTGNRRIIRRGNKRRQNKCNPVNRRRCRRPGYKKQKRPQVVVRPQRG